MYGIDIDIKQACPACRQSPVRLNIHEEAGREVRSVRCWRCDWKGTEQELEGAAFRMDLKRAVYEGVKEALIEIGLGAQEGERSCNDTD